jgi:hypothetical protein
MTPIDGLKHVAKVVLSNIYIYQTKGCVLTVIKNLIISVVLNMCDKY